AAAVASRLEEGHAQLAAGRLAEAEACFQHVLAAEPDNPDALHLLGVVAQQTARHDVAVALIRQAIARNARNPFYFFNLALALKCLGRLDEALAAYDRAAALGPRHAETHHDRGIVLAALRRPGEAVESYDRAIALRPDYADALYNRGNALKDLGCLHEALASYDRVLCQDPRHALALNNRGNVLQALHRLDLALGSYHMAVAAKPDYAEAFNNRGVVLHELKRYDEAIADYDKTLALMPACVEALFNRANTLQAQERFESALASYDRAIALRPEHAEAWYNRGNALKELGRVDEALKSYGKAQALKANYVEAHWNEAYLRLLIGDFERGLAQSEWRWQNTALGLEPRKFTQPLWRGEEPLAGKTILLYGDEGLGDAIFYCRYVPLLAARGARVILEVENGLHALLAGLAGVTRCVSPGEGSDLDSGEFDLHCPMSSLPLAFGTRPVSIPATVPYLPDTSPKRPALLGGKDRPRIGLAWSGNPRHGNDRNRSLPLEVLRPLLDTKATFVSLQKDVRPDDATTLAAAPQIVDLAASLADMADTAALIRELDLVITADTSVAHLAGALGVAVWILLPFVPDWRWQLGRDDSPWYPTARLFRQDDGRDWPRVVRHVGKALREFVKAQNHDN
ncbi:MAG: tetratricopeptide repeat protein, partial [Alphaproteobacteria bacterium]|nr:tetratricopeptide repeat protein [Alphaproteobacteria bacterium]